MKSIKEQLVEQLQQVNPDLLQSVADLQKEKLAKDLERLQQAQIEHNIQIFEIKCRIQIKKVIADIRQSHRRSYSDFEDLCAVFLNGIACGERYIGYKDIFMSFEGVLLLALIQLSRAEYCSLIRQFKLRGFDIHKTVKSAFWKVAKRIEEEGLRDEN